MRGKMSFLGLLPSSKLYYGKSIKSKASDRIYAIASFVLPFTIYCLTLNAGGGQSGNIVGMQSSMLQSHSLNVPQSGIDMIQFREKFYNVYAPGFAFLSFPFAIVGFASYSILNGYVGNAVLMDELCLAICASLSGYIVFKICLIFTRSARASLLASFALTLGTSVWPFAVSLFPNDASLLFSIMGVYLALIYTKYYSGRNYLLAISGTSIGIAALIEYAAGLFVAPLLLYMLMEHKSHPYSRRIDLVF